MLEFESKNTKGFLGTEPVGQLIVRLAIPSIVAQIVSLLYNIVDRIFIGHIRVNSTLSLTALGICFPLIVIVAAFTALFSNGAAPRSSIFLGKNDKATAENIMGNTFSSLIFIAIVLTILLFTFDAPLLIFFGASKITLPLAQKYLRIYALGTIFVQLSIGMNNFIIAEGFSKNGMISVLIGAVINIILDPIFIYTLKLGVAGAALATIIAQFFSAVYVISFLTGKKTTLQLKRKYFKFSKNILLPSVALGLGPFIMTSTESALTAAFNINLLRYGGDIAVGAMTICMAYVNLNHQIVMGFAQGAQPVISFNYGAQNKNRMFQAIKILFIVSLSCTMVMFTYIEVLPHSFIALFSNDNKLIDFTVWAIRIYALSSGIFGLQMAAQMSFISLGQAKVSSSIAILRKIILLIPLIFILPHFMTNKVFGVFLAEPVSDFISVGYTMIMFYFVSKKIRKQME